MDVASVFIEPDANLGVGGLSAPLCHVASMPGHVPFDVGILSLAGVARLEP
jgi:hypothetical protein